jgi:hypothetical protein
MRRIILLGSAVMLFSVFSASAQKRSSSFSSESYTTALGVKVYPASNGGAITLKHFFNEGIALEALGSVWDRGGRITGLVEFHWDIPGAPGLKWYVGPGAHISFYNDKQYDNYPRRSYVAPGLDGVIGLDYKFKNIPLNLSADWQPYFDFGNNTDPYRGFGADFGGIAARYTF